MSSDGTTPAAGRSGTAAPAPRAGGRVWYVARPWLVLCLLAAMLTGLCLRARAVELNRVREGQALGDVARELSLRIYTIISDNGLQGVEQALNGGRPLPRDLALAPDTYRTTLPGRAVAPKYDRLQIRLTFDDRRAVFARVIIVDPPPPGPGALMEWSERVRRFCLFAAALVAAVATVLLPAAGPWRRHVAQVSIGATLFAALAWCLFPYSSWRWWPPSDDVGALAAAAGLVLLGLVAFVLPVPRAGPRPDVCRACGYDLRGNESGVCPECGTPTRSPEQLERDRSAAAAARKLEQTEAAPVDAAEVG